MPRPDPADPRLLRAHPRRWRTLAVLLPPLLLALAACDTDPGEAEARALLDDIAAEYGRGEDPAAFAGAWTETGDLGSLSTASNWEDQAAIDSAMARVFERRNPESGATMSIDRIRMARPDLALAEATLRQDGQPVERMMLVLVPEGGTWKVASARVGRVAVD